MFKNIDFFFHIPVILIISMMPILITEETKKTRPQLNPRKLRDMRDGNVSYPLCKHK